MTSLHTYVPAVYETAAGISAWFMAATMAFTGSDENMRREHRR